MLTIRNIQIDFDPARTADAKKLDAAKETIKAAMDLLHTPAGQSLDVITEVTIEAVAAVLGEEAPAKLGMDKDYWKECILIFADAMTAITEAENKVKAELQAFDISRIKK